MLELFLETSADTGMFSSIQLLKPQQGTPVITHVLVCLLPDEHAMLNEHRP